MEWAKLPLKKYAEFSGRSRRKEYWSFVLPVIACMVALVLVENILSLNRLIGPYGPLTSLLYIAVLLPMIAVGVRRLHDTDRSAYWLLISYVPMAIVMWLLATGAYTPDMYSLVMVLLAIGCAGSILLLVFMVMEGTRGPNRYGPDPKGLEAGPTGPDLASALAAPDAAAGFETRAPDEKKLH